MKTTNRIMGITSLALGAICIIPSIIGILAGISLMTEDEIVSRVVSTILFELFIIIGGAIAAIIPSKPVATIISSVLLIAAGALQIIFCAEFSLVFIGMFSLLILSWVAVISIVFGIFLLIFSIISIIKKNKLDDELISEENEDKNQQHLNTCNCINMKKCTYCNSDIPSEAKFCPNCGKESVTVNDITPPPTAPVKKPKTKNIIIIGVVALIAVVVLISVIIGSVSTKDHIYRNVDFGMTAEEVKKAETADLKKEYSNGSLYYYIRSNQEMTVEYSFDKNGKLNLIEAYYHGDKYTEGDFFEKTKRELDLKHGYGKEYHKKNVDKDYGLVWYYDGYEWICDGYNVQFIYWEDGFLKLTYSLDE